MNGFQLKRILDLDLEFLDELPVEDGFPALLALSERNKASWLEIALILDAGENPTLVEKSRGLSTSPEGYKSFLEVGQVTTDDANWQNHYWDEVVPSFIKNDRRRASDYRNALLVLRRYHEELDQAGFDPYGDNSFTNLLKLPKAIATRGFCPEIFSNASTMNTRRFADYAAGVDMPKETPLTLKEYINVLNKLCHG